MSLKTYLESIQGKTIGVIGIGVSNTPLIELLLDAGFAVTRGNAVNLTKRS